MTGREAPVTHVGLLTTTLHNIINVRGNGSLLDFSGLSTICKRFYTFKQRLLWFQTYICNMVHTLVIHYENICTQSCHHFS